MIYESEQYVTYFLKNLLTREQILLTRFKEILPTA